MKMLPWWVPQTETSFEMNLQQGILSVGLKRCEGVKFFFVSKNDGRLRMIVD